MRDVTAYDDLGFGLVALVAVPGPDGDRLGAAPMVAGQTVPGDNETNAAVVHPLVVRLGAMAPEASALLASVIAATPRRRIYGTVRWAWIVADAAEVAGATAETIAPLIEAAAGPIQLPLDGSPR